MTLLLDLFVAGLPAPQGSKRLVGKVMMEASKKVGPWRQDVKYQVAQQYNGPIINWAVFVEIEFLFHRPKSHYTSKGGLRPAAPLHLISRGHGDLDKLLRSTFDALSATTGGSVFADDAFVVKVAGSKRYCLESEQSGALIRVRQFPC